MKLALGMVTICCDAMSCSTMLLNVKRSGRVVRQYRACVVDLLGLEIMCGVHEHVCHCTLSTSHPDLVYFLFVPALYSTF